MVATENSATDIRIRVLLSVQRALVGEIIPEMRAVDVESSQARIVIRVFTEGDASESVREDFDAGMVTQVVADFPYPGQEDPTVAFEFVRCDSPNRVPVRGICFAQAGVRFDTNGAG